VGQDIDTQDGPHTVEWSPFARQEKRAGQRQGISEVVLEKQPAIGEVRSRRAVRSCERPRGQKGADLPGAAERGEVESAPGIEPRRPCGGGRHRPADLGHQRVVDPRLVQTLAAALLHDSGAIEPEGRSVMRAEVRRQDHDRAEALVIPSGPGTKS
jgi:hypothetical protein